MKVVICNPPWPGGGYGTRSNIRWPHRRGDKVLTFPIYLAYAVSLLRENGFDVKGIDAVKEEWGIFKFVEEIKKIKPEIIAMEVCAPSLMYDLQTAELLKKEVNCKIVFIGPHVTYAHKDLIGNYNFIDYCIRNEFEFTLLDLCYVLKDKKKPDKIKGLTLRKKNKILVNEQRQYIKNIDLFPFPDREDFKIEDYQQAFFGGKKTALMISSRGCPFRCSFCLWPNTLTGHLSRVRSAKNIVDEIQMLIEKNNIDEIYFDDDTFCVDKKKTKEMCKEIIKRKIEINWLCMSRVNLVNEEILRIMKKAGCKEVFYGLESGSKVILNAENKGITKKQMHHAIRITQKAGIKATGSFIIGLPDESLKTINETLKFAINLKADYVQFTLAAPFPGTVLYEKAKKLNLLHLNSLEDLDGCHGLIISTKYLKKDQLKGVIRQLYIRYYTHPSIIWQNLKSIKDINDIRKIIRGARSILSRIIYYKK